MDKVSVSLTVFFEEPFWIGIYQRVSDGKLTVSKITFGPEPKDYEVKDYLLDNWTKLKFSPPVKAKERQDKKVNPKRMQRDVERQLEKQGTGTKSQQALKLQKEETKTAGREKSRRIKEEEKQRQFELKQQKRKEKHRGR